MSLESANEFISATKANPGLMAKVAQAIMGKSPPDAAQAVSALGLINGFKFSGHDAIQAHQALLKPQSLSEDELDHVAGGAGQLGMAKPVGGGILMPNPPVVPIFVKETKPVTGVMDPAAGW